MSHDDIANLQRMRGLAAYDLFNTDLKERLDVICRRTAEQLDVPLVLVTAVLDTATAVVATSGGPHDVVSEMGGAPNELSICPAVVRSREPLIVDDLTQHPDHAANPAVQMGMVCAYAGVPLLLPSGVIVGSFCTMSADTHEFTDADVAALTTTADEIISLIQRYEVAHQR